MAGQHALETVTLSLELCELDLSENPGFDIHLCELAKLLGWRIPLMKTLKLASTPFHGKLSDLAGFVGLEHLDLSFNANISGEIADLAPLVKLKVLNMRRCAKVAGGLEGVSSPAKLESLDLVDTLVHLTLSDLSTTFKKLRRLSLGSSSLNGDGSKVCGDLHMLSPLRDLTELELSNCPAVTGALSGIAQLERLVKIFSNGCPALHAEEAIVKELFDMFDSDKDGILNRWERKMFMLEA